MTQELVPYICDRCSQPVTAADDGVLFITHADRSRAMQHADAVAVREARRVLADHQKQQAGQIVTTPQAEAVDSFLDDQPVADWHMVHDRCLKGEEESSMAWDMNAAQIRTFRKLLSMTLHLQGKKWIEASNFRAWVQHYAGSL